MAKIPVGGYLEAGVRAEVSKEVGDNLDKFDMIFTTMMNQLQEAWTTDKAALDRAVVTMFSLREPAQSLMKISISADGKSGTYGPCFRLVSPAP